MSLYDSKLYLDDIRKTAQAPLPWEKLQNRSVLLSGATGLLGSFLTDVVMYRNSQGMNCTLIALGRSREMDERRFSH